MKKRWFMTMVIAMMILALGIPVSAAPKLNKKTAKVTVGKTVKLTVKGTKSKVKWKSSKKSVATVSSKGVVKGKKPGTAKITATVGKKKLVCKVTVRKNMYVSKGTDTVSPSFFGYEMIPKKLYYKKNMLVCEAYFYNGSPIGIEGFRNSRIILYNNKKLLANGFFGKINMVCPGKSETKVILTFSGTALKDKHADLAAIKKLYWSCDFAYPIW